MKYVMTKAEKKSQQNLLFQVWRFAVLSFKFMQLIRATCATPDPEKVPAPKQSVPEQHHYAAGRH